MRQAETVVQHRALAEQTFGSRAEEFLELYPVTTDAELVDVTKMVAREGGVMRTARNWRSLSPRG